MKKRGKVIFMVFALVCVLCIQKQTVFAANVTAVSATGNSTSATISGTAETGVTAVAIMVYDSTGTNLVIMESVSVNDSHTFSTTIDLAAGSYLIKVADYDGGDYKETTVTVGASGNTSGGNGTGNTGGDPSNSNGTGNTGGSSSNNNAGNTSSTNSTNSNTAGNNQTASAKTVAESAKAPKTGDGFTYELYVVMMVAVLGLSACIGYNRKQKNKM